MCSGKQSLTSVQCVPFTAGAHQGCKGAPPCPLEAGTALEEMHISDGQWQWPECGAHPAPQLCLARSKGAVSSHRIIQTGFKKLKTFSSLGKPHHKRCHGDTGKKQGHTHAGRESRSRKGSGAEKVLEIHSPPQGSLWGHPLVTTPVDPSGDRGSHRRSSHPRRSAREAPREAFHTSRPHCLNCVDN